MHGKWTNAIGRRLALMAGYGLFGLGFAGLFLPILPTTIFWIGAAACFAKSSPAMRQRISRWPGVGQAVDDFLAQGAIARRGKAWALAGMLAGLVLTGLALGPGLPLAAATLLIALGGAYVATRPRPIPVAR